MQPVTTDGPELKTEEESTTLTYHGWASAYNYKCPDCNGEFNTPAQSFPDGTRVDNLCPFCGRKMEGLK